MNIDNLIRYINGMKEAFLLIDSMGWNANKDTWIGWDEDMLEQYIYNVSNLIVNNIRKVLGIRDDDGEITTAFIDQKTAEEILSIAIAIREKERTE